MVRINLLLPVVLLFAISACSPASPGADYVQVATSGVLVADDKGQFILELVVSPVTTMFDQEPGTNSAMLSTEVFAYAFDDLFATGKPNAALITQNDQGQTVSVAIELTSATYDDSVDTIEYLVSPLIVMDEQNSLSGAGQLVTLESLIGDLGNCTLYIDDGECCITTVVGGVIESQEGTCCNGGGGGGGGIEIEPPTEFFD